MARTARSSAAPSQWAARAIQQVATADLLPYAANARTHSDAQVEQIAASIREFGFVNPVLVDEHGEIIAGHGRTLAAKLLGLERVPVIRRDGLSDAQKRALRLADNKIALNSGWDEALLAAELSVLADMDFDINLTGFDTTEIDALLAAPAPEPPPPATTDPDGEDPADQDVEPSRQRVTRRGDVWLLGDHRLMCGDSTSAEDVARLVGAEPAALLFTSPPYGHQRNYTTGGIGDWDVLMQGVFGAVAAAVAPAGQVLVNLGMIHRDSEWQPYWNGWLDWMRGQGWRRFGLYVWDQGPGLPGDWNGRFGPAFEFLFHFNREPRRPNKITQNKLAGGTRGGGQGMRSADGTVGTWTGDGSVQEMRIPDSVIRIGRAHPANRVKDGAGHPAVFPVKLPEFVIESFTDPGQVVLEPFSGSGTTLLACQRSGRRGRAMDIGAEYVDLAIARWHLLHPDIPVILEGDGRPYAAIAQERADGVAEERANG